MAKAKKVITTMDKAKRAVLGVGNKVKRAAKQTFTTQGQFTKMRTSAIKAGKKNSTGVSRSDVYRMADTATDRAKRNRRIAAGVGAAAVVGGGAYAYKKNQKKKNQGK